MKKYLILLFSCTFLRVVAQKDTVFITIGQEIKIETEAPQQFETRFDKAFGTQEPTRWILKWNALNAVSSTLTRSNYFGKGAYISQDWDFGAEYRVKTGLSIQSNFSFGATQLFGNVFKDAAILRTQAYNIAPRWYFGLPRKIKQGRSANNLNGNYLALSLGYAQTRVNYVNFPVGEDYEYLNVREQSAALRFGIQRRLFRYGYFDLNYGLGIKRHWKFAEQYADEKPAISLFTNQHITLGLAFAYPNLPKTPGGMCDVFQCFQEDRRMLKIDLLNLLSMEDLKQLTGKPSIALEQKIGNSPFSVEFSVAMPYNRATYTASHPVHERTIVERGLGVEASFEPRWYFRMKHRIAHGKSGNNLNGLFVGVQVNESYFENRVFIYNDLTSEKRIEVLQELSFTPVLGLQYRLFDRVFVQYKTGIGQRKTWETVYGRNPGNIYPLDWYGRFLSEFKIGLCF